LPRLAGSPWLVEELARAARCTSAHVYALIATGQCGAVALGHSKRIPDSEALRILGGLTAEQGEALRLQMTAEAEHEMAERAAEGEMLSAVAPLGHSQQTPNSEVLCILGSLTPEQRKALRLQIAAEIAAEAEVLSAV
jgi:hypothetical protein